MVSEQEQIEIVKQKKMLETYDRLTAVSHIKVESFHDHNRIEGYYEDRTVGHLFGCDRLMKIDTMFGRLQMGYNPNRGRSFIFANLKTSRYDTVSSRYQKEMAEYQMKTLLKGKNENRGYISKYSQNSSVLIEKAEAKPWTERSVSPYYNRINMEALKKTMPFFDKSDEERELMELKNKQKDIRNEIASNSRSSDYEENVDLNQQLVKNLAKENMLEALIYRKESGSRLFLRKINYAFDIQKHEMFEYYKHKKSHLEEEGMANVSPDIEEEDNNDENS